MNTRDALLFVGKRIHVTFTDRHGDVHTVIGRLFDVQHVPMYGNSLMLESCEVSLDRVLAILETSDQAA